MVDYVDFDEPTIVTEYADVLSYLRANMKTLAKMDFPSEANTPVNTIRLQNGRIEKYTGSGWVNAAAEWDITVKNLSDAPNGRTIRGVHNFPDGITGVGDTAVGGGYTMVSNSDGTPTVHSSTLEIDTEALDISTWGVIGPPQESGIDQQWGALSLLNLDHTWIRVYLSIGLIGNTTETSFFSYACFRKPGSQASINSDLTRRGGVLEIGDTSAFRTWTGEITVPVSNKMFEFAWQSNFQYQHTYNLQLVGYGI